MRLAWVAATLTALTLLTSVTSSPIQLEIEIRKAGGSGSGPGPGLHGDSLEMNGSEEKINANGYRNGMMGMLGKSNGTYDPIRASTKGQNLAFAPVRTFLKPVFIRVHFVLRPVRSYILAIFWYFLGPRPNVLIWPGLINIIE